MLGIPKAALRVLEESEGYWDDNNYLEIVLNNQSKVFWFRIFSLPRPLLLPERFYPVYQLHQVFPGTVHEKQNFEKYQKMRFFSRFKSYILVRNHHIKKITFDERMGHGKSKTIEPMTCRNIKL